MSTVDLLFNYGGYWQVGEDDLLHYVNGEVDLLENFDPDYLNYGDILFRY